MFRREFVTHSMVALSAGPAIFATTRSRVKWPQSDYRIVYNDDGHTLQHVSGLNDLLEKAVDRFIGTQVDALFWSVGHSDIYFFNSKVGEIYGRHVTRFKHAGGLQLFEGLQKVLRDREDYLQALADRSRKIGIQFFVSMRMNDCHDSPEGWNASDQYSQFKRAHPELLLGKSVHPAFATGYNFAYEKSRQNKFKVIEEIVLNYDIDGFELDFLRHPAFFKPDEAYCNRYLITGIVRKVRSLLDKVSERRGKPIRLAVRVPSSFAIAFRLGFDVPSWIEEGLMDVVTSGTPRGHELDLSMTEYVEATQGKRVTLLGQIGLYHSLKQSRATALNYWKQGVNGIYLFNWYAPLGQRDRWRESLVEIGDPRFLEYQDKHYVISDQVGEMWQRSHPKAQLPLKILNSRSAGLAQIQFFVGDDIGAALRARKLVISRMVMRFEEVLGDDDLQLKLNGVVLPKSAGEMKFEPTLFGKEFWFHLPFKAKLLKVGINQLEFVLSKRNPRLAAPLILAEISLFIDYKTEG